MDERIQTLNQMMEQWDVAKMDPAFQKQWMDQNPIRHMKQQFLMRDPIASIRLLDTLEAPFREALQEAKFTTEDVLSQLPPDIRAKVTAGEGLSDEEKAQIDQDLAAITQDFQAYAAQVAGSITTATLPNIAGTAPAEVIQTYPASTLFVQLTTGKELEESYLHEWAQKSGIIKLIQQSPVRFNISDLKDMYKLYLLGQAMASAQSSADVIRPATMQGVQMPR
jgi:hypothetical protein